tara:strand:+ start:721 stop:987 length:267 start_codon:yes stop_codon:yes gene_type:complete
MAIIDLIEVHNVKKDTSGSFLEVSEVENTTTIKFKLKKFNPETGESLEPVLHAEVSDKDLQIEFNRIKNQLDTIEAFCKEIGVRLKSE